MSPVTSPESASGQGASTGAFDGASTPSGDGPVTPESGVKAPVRRRSRRRNLIEWAVVLAVALLVAAGLRAYFIQAFYVPSASMTPTLQIGDRIIVIKRGYSIQRGDILVFKRPPGDTLDPTINDLVKRVIGLPGETIWSSHGIVYVDGKALREPWLPAHDPLGATPITRQTIPAGEYFMMGDNRAFSYDSRYWGPIPRSLVVGKVIVIVWRNGHPYVHFF